ncbi:MAG: SDR family oxidoreductase [Deltaproteobacteria bacterium]|nr:SDR family oxidoreductase [Deltaproteobacteria bacterium]
MSRVLIVGSNRGIGLELTRQLAARGDEVLAACRKPSPELLALGVEVIEGVDVREDAGVTRLLEAIGERDLDLAVVVAGVLTRVDLDDLDFDVMRAQFEVNALGPLRVAAALRPRLSRGSKLALITSRMGSLADNTSGGHYGYRMSKAALNMAGRSLSVDLRADDVTVLLLHPGFVRTEMTGHQGLIDVSESAAGLLERIHALGLEETGSFWHESGERLEF